MKNETIFGEILELQSKIIDYNICVTAVTRGVECFRRLVRQRTDGDQLTVADLGQLVLV